MAKWKVLVRWMGFTTGSVTLSLMWNKVTVWSNPKYLPEWEGVVSTQGVRFTAGHTAASNSWLVRGSNRRVLVDARTHLELQLGMGFQV